MLEKIIKKGIITSALLLGLNGCIETPKVGQIDVKENISQEYDSTVEDSYTSDVGMKNTEFVEVVNDKCNSITQGQSQNQLINQLQYEVTLKYVDSESAKFSVNGQRTPKMNIGTSFKLFNEKTIKLTETLHESYAGGTHEAEFCLLDQVEEPEVFENTCDEIGDYFPIIKYFEKNESESKYQIAGLEYNISLQEVTTDENITKIKISINGEEGDLINNEPTSIGGLHLTTLEIYNQGEYEGSIKGADICFQKDIINNIPQDEIMINEDYECDEFQNFPEEFHENGIFNGYMIIGENASASDNLAAIDISANMKYVNQDNELVQVQFIDATKLDSEIAEIYTQNLISIGSPCVNSVTAELLGNPTNCSQGFYPGEAKIISLQHKETGNIALIVAGYSGSDTRLAGKVIAHKTNELQEIDNCIITVEGTTYNDANVE